MPWFPPHVPVAARRARVARVSDELRRNGVDVQPVHIEGRTIARSFWGRRWCHHLESCSDFENRLPRGRAYVRNGSVCHLDVHAGGVDAMVVGSDLYHVVVRIRKLRQAAWKAIRAESGRLREGGRAARVGVLLADAPPGLVHQEPVEDVGRFVDSGRDGLGGERGESVGDVRVRLDAGFGPVPGVDQVEGFAPAAGREETGRRWRRSAPVPQKAAIGSAAWASTTMANARSNASPSTCQRAMRISSQNPCVVVASAIFRRPRLTPSASSTLSRPMRSRQDSPVRRCVKASVNRVASSTSSRMSVMRASGIRR